MVMLIFERQVRLVPPMDSSLFDAFTNDLKYKALDLTASADVIPLVANTEAACHVCDA